MQASIEAVSVQSDSSAVVTMKFVGDLVTDYYTFTVPMSDAQVDDIKATAAVEAVIYKARLITDDASAALAQQAQQVAAQQQAAEYATLLQSGVDDSVAQQQASEIQPAPPVPADLAAVVGYSITQ